MHHHHDSCRLPRRGSHTGSCQRAARLESSQLSRIRIRLTEQKKKWHSSTYSIILVDQWKRKQKRSYNHLLHARCLCGNCPAGKRFQEKTLKRNTRRLLGMLKPGRRKHSDCARGRSLSKLLDRWRSYHDNTKMCRGLVPLSLHPRRRTRAVRNSRVLNHEPRATGVRFQWLQIVNCV
jgi:hypothetical protein